MVQPAMGTMQTTASGDQPTMCVEKVTFEIAVHSDVGVEANHLASPFNSQGLRQPLYLASTIPTTNDHAVHITKEEREKGMIANGQPHHRCATFGSRMASFRPVSVQSLWAKAGSSI